jgi:hypothetical protein
MWGYVVAASGDYWASAARAMSGATMEAVMSAFLSTGVLPRHDPGLHRRMLSRKADIIGIKRTPLQSVEFPTGKSLRGGRERPRWVSERRYGTDRGVADDHQHH